MDILNDTARWFYYVIIDEARVQKLKSDVARRFQFYPPISINRIDRNNVIPCDSLCVEIRGSISVSMRDHLTEFVAGWISCADLENSASQMAGVTKDDQGLYIEAVKPAPIRRIHIVPLGDTNFHAAQETCWCHPLEMDPNMWVHNAHDLREAHERINGAKCSDGWTIIEEICPPKMKAL